MGEWTGGKELSRMSPEVKVVHFEAIYFYRHERYIRNEANREVGMKPGTLGRIKDEGLAGAAIKSTAPTTEDTYVVDMARIERFRRIRNKMKTKKAIWVTAMDAYYNGGLEGRAISRACRCGPRRVASLLAEIRGYLVGAYDGFEAAAA